MTVPYFDDGQVSLFLGDCLDVLAGLPDCSVDSVATDPPYGLEFMGREWDTFKPAKAQIRTRADGRTNPAEGKSVVSVPESYTAGQPFQAWCQAWATECLRVLKPGGHLLAFGGSRTWHRLACAVEDAGFEMRDSIADLTGRDAPGLMWVYGAGFPKSADAGRAVDMKVCQLPGRHCMRQVPKNATPGDHVCPESAEGKPWRGWGTALKPAWEPIVVGRKPAVGTLAQNLLEYGTGAMNVDGCRVAAACGDYAHPGNDNRSTTTTAYNRFEREGRQVPPHDAGRWPPNVLLTHSADCEPIGVRRVRGITGGTGNHDGSVYGARSNAGAPVRDYADADGMETVEAWDCAPGCPAAELDSQTGTLTSGAWDGTRNRTKTTDTYGAFPGGTEQPRGGSSGGASRFFPVFRYEAKAPASERPRLPDGTAHPTVKPLALMRWLVRLVTPPGGTVLDLFAGSGTTGEACVIEGFGCVLIEKDPASAELIKARLGKPIQPDLFGGAA
jgi:site-specific DNA-methyltransferase (adenine-specific)